MDLQTIKVLQEGDTFLIKICRPEALNALNNQVLKDLNFLLESEQIQKAKVIIVTGEGEKAFVAGADIKEINSLSPSKAKDFAELGQMVFRKLEGFKVPIIAAVNGFALGGGLELAMSCDFIYASEKAKFGLPEASLGLIPGFGGTVRLSRYVGLAQAKELIYTGKMFSAQEALQLGLVNKVLKPEDLILECKKTADIIKTRGPLAVESAKKSIMRSYDLEIDQAMEVEASHFSELFKSKDVQEGTNAFIQKRTPHFTGQ